MQETYLVHHGIKGQKWGIRRFQNPDGSLTAEGERRYGSVEKFRKSKEFRKYAKEKYKSNVQKVRENQSKIEDKHDKTYKDLNNIYKDSVKSAKQLYKDKKIDRNAYKYVKKTLKKDVSNAKNKVYAKDIKNIYDSQKQVQKHYTTYIAEIKGKDSKAYNKAKKFLDSNIANYGNMTIYKNPDGSFNVVSVYAY